MDVFVAAVLKQETISKEKQEEYETLEFCIKEMAEDIEDLKRQNAGWSKHCKFLEQACEKLKKDVEVTDELQRKEWDAVQFKEMEEHDLTKQLQKQKDKQKEFLAAYEVVKAERNKYVGLIQSASQKLSEMKERLKVLSSEIMILQLESTSKDGTIDDCKVKVQKNTETRDNLQNQLTKSVNELNDLNAVIEQYVIEIDKLNSIISTVEKEIVVVKREYEVAIQGRKFFV